MQHFHGRPWSSVVETYPRRQMTVLGRHLYSIEPAHAETRRLEAVIRMAEMTDRHGGAVKRYFCHQVAMNEMADPEDRASALCQSR